MSRGRFNDWSDGSAAVGVEQVARAVDLAIVVVSSTGSTQAAPRRQDGCIGQEESDRMVVTGNGLRGDFREIGGDGVPYFGLKLAAVVGKWDAIGLAA